MKLKVYRIPFWKRVFTGSLTWAVVLCALTAGTPVLAETAARSESSVRFDSPNEGGYRSYINRLETDGAQNTVDMYESFGCDRLTNYDGTADVRSGYEGATQPVLVWEDEAAYAEWTVTAPQTGFYELHVQYMTIGNSVDTPKRTLLIDGEQPFKEASGINFYRLWTDNGNKRMKANGDELRPKAEEQKVWQTRPLYDGSRLYTAPLRLHLTQGDHIVRLEYVRGALAIQKLMLVSPENIPTYAEKAQEYARNGYTEASEDSRIEAETLTVRTDSSIQMQYDEDPASYPSAMHNRVLNTIGGNSWSTLGQTITWTFEVPQTGLYKLYMRSLQNYNDGMSIFRKIEIDGKVPFREMEAYAFQNRDGWRVEQLQDEEGSPYLFYLEEGKRHTLSMTNVLGPAADVVNALELDAFALSEIIQNIILITGNTPDLNFNYEIDRYAPNIIEDLRELGDRIPEQIEQIEALSRYKPAILNNLLLLQKQIRDMVEDPFRIPRKLNEITNVQMAIGDWITLLRSSPYMLDYIVLAPPSQELEKGQSTFWQRVVKFVRNFMKSFIEDYDSIDGLNGGGEMNSVIDVWVARGKEWVEIMKEITDEDFTPKTGIGVRYNIVPAGQLNVGGLNTLMLANASGTAPDVACGVDSGLPVEFGIRGATVDLSGFPDYKTVESSFVKNVNTPFHYQDAVFALPETMSFMVQFYRTDVLSKLGIEPPDTWEELYGEVLPRLKQNNMNFYYMPSIQSFTPILYQNGGRYYSENGLHCALNTDEAYSAFVQWTNLYNLYKVPISGNFFNRFRSGEMPIGISDFNFYTQLSVAAPELQGRYSIAPMIGTRRSDGTIDRTAGGGVTGIVMMDQTEQPDQAWAFMKWWMSEETQVQYGYAVESYFGVSARWASANYAAFQQLPWDAKDLKVIREQYSFYQDIPVVLGGYFTSRHLNNAWNRIIMEKVNPRDSLEKAVKDIEKEMISKQRQYLQ